MSNWWQPIIDGFAQMSGWEGFAALLGLGYIIFAARESLWCWPMAFISTLIYTVLFWEGQLPMQALLNFYYMGMAIYGFMLWRKHGQKEDDLAITSWCLYKHIAFISIGVFLTWLTASYLQSIDASQRPYLDASVTIFSVMNTVLMARKILQNWLYWIIIDAAAIMLYYQTGYFATMALFAVYTILAFAGYVNWKRLYDINSENRQRIAG